VTVASWFALGLRYERFLGGDLASRALVGVEVGAP
jgi:hypothetical protein